MDLPFVKRTLPNGLDVIVHEDRRTPIVAVNLWYHVGSKDEQPGRTGFAHLFEHLMFEGSQHHDRGYFPPLQRAGASLNGSTNSDRTNYWEVVPTGALELALWLESDRMGYLLPALTEAKFENQRSVVINERRQSYENRPYGLATAALVGALFAPDHPYHWMTIGETADLQAMSLDQVHEFFKTFYHPGNASIALAGDIAADEAFAMVERCFGEIAGGPAVPRPDTPAEAPTPSTPRLLHEDRVEAARLYLAWTSPAMFAPGDAAMDVLADILANGKTSRLYRTLVYDRRLATDIAAAQHSRELTSFFLIVATAAPGRSLTEIADAIRDEIARLSDAGAEERERERCLAQVEAAFASRLQCVGGFGGKSDQLNAYNVLVGHPGYFEADLDRYRAVTTEAVRAASVQLTPARMTALSVVPRGQPGAALAGSVPVSVS